MKNLDDFDLTENIIKNKPNTDESISYSKNRILFQIGELARICGVTRKAILVYENAGALKPAYVDPHSNFRYFSAENISRVRSIRFLQSVGLSLKEISEYYNNPDKVHYYLNRLIETREILNHRINELQLRATERGDLTVHKIIAPRQVFFAKRHICKSVSEIADRLMDTDVEAVKTGFAQSEARIFTLWNSIKADEFDVINCIPMTEEFDGPERIVLEESPSICIYFRGPYNELKIARNRLFEYAEENNYEITGRVSTVYLEGKITFGNKPENFLTQVLVPIKSF